jgi:hypothetical protein
MARTQGDGAHDGRAGIGRSAPPVNAFTADFLDRLLESDQPATAAEAAVAGPWEVEPVGGYGWGVFRQADGGGAAPPPEEGGAGGGGGTGRRGEPAGLLEERQDALLLAAALPGSARGGELRLRPDRGPDGYPLVAGRRDVGRLAWFDTQLVSTLAAFRALVACPRCLALVLEAAGHDALEQAGRIVARRTGSTEAS